MEGVAKKAIKVNAANLNDWNRKIKIKEFICNLQSILVVFSSLYK